MSSATTDDVFQTFLELEKAAEFFDVRIDGVPIWERIRHPVYRDIKKRTWGRKRSAYLVND